MSVFDVSINAVDLPVHPDALPRGTALRFDAVDAAMATSGVVLSGMTRVADRDLQVALNRWPRGVAVAM